MTYQPPQQPPVMHGYPATPPNNDWKPPPAKKPQRWGLAAAVVAGAVALVVAIGAVMDRSTFTPEEAASEAKQVCTEDYVPGKLAAMADPESARFAAVTVAVSGDTYLVKGRVTADRISNDRFDGQPNRYRFECSLKRTGDEWVRGYATVLPI